MTFQEQINKIKENWFIVILLVIGLLFLVGGDILSIGSFGGYSDSIMSSKSYNQAYDMDESYSTGRSYYGESDFAPEVVERKIVKTSSLSVEAPKGGYFEAENKLRNIVESSDSFIINENVNRYGEKNKEYHSGWFQLKVDTAKYDSVVSQLKNIGEVQSFTERANDVTGSYTNQEIELEVEKTRLDRYKSMLEEADDVEDKIELTDRIYDQERRISYIENSLNNMDQRIDYSTISVNINEKRSDYINVEIVKFSKLIRNIVDSLNGLFIFVAVILPWSIAGSIIWFFYRIFKKKKDREEVSNKSEENSRKK